MTNNAQQRGDALPPQDLDCEMALLGSMMMSANVIADVVPIIRTAKAFYTDVHQSLYGVLVSIHERGDPVDLMIVSAELKRRDLFGVVGGQDYMIELAESFAEWANAEYYAREVRVQYERRCVIEIASAMRIAAYATLADEPATIVANGIRRLESICSAQADESVREIREYIPRLAIEPDGKGPKRCIPTGLASLDLNIGGGLNRGAMTVLAGRPSMGKTSLGLQFAIAAVKAGVNALFVSVEMTPVEIAARFLAIATATPLDVVLRKSSPEDITAMMNFACNEWGEGKLFISDGIANTRDILAAVKSRVRTDAVGLVLIDHLQLCVPHGRHENRNLAVSAMSAAFKALALNQEIAVVVMSQLSREAVHDSHLRLSHLRDSGSIEQDADLVFMLGKSVKDDLLRRNIVRMIDFRIEKNRNGPVLAWDMMFDSPTTRFIEIPRAPVVDEVLETDSVPF